ncbi:MAG: RNA-binding protein [Deltaproteobacteria bacterium HGW-Deltaproteobacteria-21]|nr:MAG: RNA-binding protein [Deltaproteobacteria bacterium HGW-Deltaproteobacteria-21]
MCEANAFLTEQGREEKILDNVDELDIQGEEIRIVNIFGEQKILKAKFKSYSAAERKILLEPLR